MLSFKNPFGELKYLRWQNFIFLLIAGCVNAFGVTVFLAPVNLYDSGISGTSILLSQISPDYMSLSMFLLILNIPLFLFGLKKQGMVFTVYSIFAVVVYAMACEILFMLLIPRPLFRSVTWRTFLRPTTKNAAIPSSISFTLFTAHFREEIL